GVLPSRGVENERVDSVGGILTARGVTKERVESDGGVKVTRGVGPKRVYPKTGVALRRSNPRQRERENECRNKDGKKRSSVGRMAEHMKPSLNSYLKT